MFSKARQLQNIGNVILVIKLENCSINFTGNGLPMEWNNKITILTHR